MSGRRNSDLLPLADLLPGFEFPAEEPSGAIPKVLTVQGRHHFTRTKQIDALTGVGEDPTPDLGFMGRLLTLCSLPRTDPGNRHQYKRQNGPYKLIMIAGGDNKLPFGNLPRLLLAWVCTEAIKTQDRKLILGPSLASFMQELGINSDSGGSRGDRTRLKTQIDRLFNCHVDMIYETSQGKVSTGGRLAPKAVLWWDYHKPQQDTLWKSWVELGEEMFNEIVAHPVPLDMRILKTMRRSSLGLDLYMWLSYKSFALYSQGKKPERLSWERLYLQFGVDPSKANDKFVVRDFREDFLREMKKLKLCWPTLKYAAPKGCFEVHPCSPSVPPKQIAT
jgi:Plasmid encoded RepA protein